MTLKQKQLAKAIVENAANDEPVTAKELLVSVGYKESTAVKKPGEIIEQQGVQDALALYGFTEENAKNVVTKIMLNEEVEPNARLKAADMTFKVMGSYAPERSISLNATIKGEIKDNTKLQAIKDKFEQELYGQFTSTNQPTGQDEGQGNPD